MSTMYGCTGKFTARIQEQAASPDILGKSQLRRQRSKRCVYTAEHACLPSATATASRPQDSNTSLRFRMDSSPPSSTLSFFILASNLCRLQKLARKLEVPAHRGRNLLGGGERFNAEQIIRTGPGYAGGSVPLVNRKHDLQPLNILGQADREAAGGRLRCGFQIQNILFNTGGSFEPFL